MFTMPSIIHITITSPNINPNDVMNKFLSKNNTELSFIPAVTLQDAHKKLDEVIERSKRTAKEKTEWYKKMTINEFVKFYYGYEIYDEKSKMFGGQGNVNDRFSDYELGEEVFITTKCERKSQEVFKNIDWEKMKKEAHEKAIQNSLSYSKSDKDDFIKIREIVHSQPSSFIDKQGIWHQSDEEADNHIESFNIYCDIWNDALKTCDDDDVFTHWNLIE